MDAIIAAVYDVISGPPGDRDWNRFRSLFVPEGRLIPVVKGEGGASALRILKVEDYVARSSASMKQNGWFESEIARKQEEFGHIAQVFSTYEGRRARGEAPTVRGINSFQLFYDGRRWWIVEIFWDGEGPGQAIPGKYLPGAR
ncbi:MAG: hypothetical protein JO041_11785 [Acidobacteria bacterium]|nr:hypothetical protein [Acidobacteriota bacterium]